MAQCIKTGADVLLLHNGSLLHGDLYEVDGTYLFHYNPHSLKWAKPGDRYCMSVDGNTAGYTFLHLSSACVMAWGKDAAGDFSYSQEWRVLEK